MIKTDRKIFLNLRPSLTAPSLLEIQRQSYQKFLERDLARLEAPPAQGNYLIL
jgi:hypothetical protein